MSIRGSSSNVSVSLVSDGDGVPVVREPSRFSVQSANPIAPVTLSAFSPFVGRWTGAVPSWISIVWCVYPVSLAADPADFAGSLTWSGDPSVLSRFNHLDRIAEVADRVPEVVGTELVGVERDLHALLVGVGGDLEWLREINSKSIIPDLTIFLHVEVDTSQTRRAKSNLTEELTENREMLERVRENYLEIADTLQSEGETSGSSTARGRRARGLPRLPGRRLRPAQRRKTTPRSGTMGESGAVGTKESMAAKRRFGDRAFDPGRPPRSG